VKTFIVQRLAMYDTPQQVADAVKDEFNVDVVRQHVRIYDATQTKSAKKWRALFNSTRKQFLEKIADIPIANRAVRLRRLERMAVAAEAKGNRPLAAQLLEQAAKEVGDTFTNRRELTGKGGAPLVPKHDLDEMTTEQLVAYAAKIAEAKP
jgi:hypothetical protein